MAMADSQPDESGLAEVFLGVRPCSLDGAGVDRLLAELLRVVEEARRRWQGVAVDAADLVSALAERLPPSWEPPAPLPLSPAADLYLAVGAASGDARALGYFEALLCSSAVMSAVEPFRAQGLMPADVIQGLRQRLLAPEPGQRARILSYSARGSLQEWLRVAAVRLAVDLQRQLRSKDVPLEPDFELPLDEADPEMTLLRRQHGEALTQAMRAAFEQLSDRDVNILRMHFIDGVSPDKIGKLYAVNRTTIWRWMTQARNQWMTGTRSLLMKNLKLTQTQVTSLMHNLQSGFHVSLGRWLGERA
jgi:RNA polymerase sigma-70 factor (ECF subfamily)